MSKVINWFDINYTENDNEYGITSESRCLKHFVLGEPEKNEKKNMMKERLLCSFIVKSLKLIVVPQLGYLITKSLIKIAYYRCIRAHILFILIKFDGEFSFKF